jgi:hypothetical protein
MNRYYGIEIELENVPNTLWEPGYYYWAVDGDGSLRNRGAEFRFRKPFDISRVGDALTELQDQLNLHPNVDASHRCGVHVHMDARDMSSKQIANLMLNYMMIEPSLFASLQGDRVSNNFCVPYFHSMDSAHSLYRVFNNWDAETLSLVASKYAALNAASYLEISTIEWRMFPAVLPVVGIAQWVGMIDDLKLTSLEKVMTEDEAKDFCITHFKRATEAEMDIGLSTYYFAKFEPEPAHALRGRRPARPAHVLTEDQQAFDAFLEGDRDIDSEAVRTVMNTFINWGDDEPEQQRDDEEEV